MADYPYTPEGLRQALVDLGDTPDAVAHTLDEGGWRGRRNDCARCPVARYLGAKFGRPSVIDVGPDSVSVTRELWIPDEYGMGYTEPRCIACWVPRPVREFMDWFDFAQRYNFLEAA